MLRNNVELDLKTRFIEDGITQTEIAEKVGVSLPYVNRITRGREQIVNKTFIKILDELGYYFFIPMPVEEFEKLSEEI